MASIQVGSSHGRRALDHDVPLIPFIDLLLCCVMFLLVTAVWNRLAAMQATTSPPGAEAAPDAAPPAPPLRVLVQAGQYVVAGELGDHVELADLEALRAHLAPRRDASASGDVVVTADDGIEYAAVIATMDTVVSAGFEQVSMGQ